MLPHRWQLYKVAREIFYVYNLFIFSLMRMKNVKNRCTNETIIYAWTFALCFSLYFARTISTLLFSHRTFVFYYTHYFCFFLCSFSLSLSPFSVSSLFIEPAMYTYFNVEKRERPVEVEEEYIGFHWPWTSFSIHFYFSRYIFSFCWMKSEKFPNGFFIINTFLYLLKCERAFFRRMNFSFSFFKHTNWVFFYRFSDDDDQTGLEEISCEIIDESINFQLNKHIVLWTKFIHKSTFSLAQTHTAIVFLLFISCFIINKMRISFQIHNASCGCVYIVVYYRLEWPELCEWMCEWTKIVKIRSRERRWMKIEKVREGEIFSINMEKSVFVFHGRQTFTLGIFVLFDIEYWLPLSCYAHDCRFFYLFIYWK